MYIPLVKICGNSEVVCVRPQQDVSQILENRFLRELNPKIDQRRKCAALLRYVSALRASEFARNLIGGLKAR